MEERSGRGQGELDARSLRYLLAVARDRSFTTAAASLQMSQPALSQAVARVESLVGGRLVVRDARGVAREGNPLTPAGQALVADAERITELLDRALVRARRIAEAGERERLTVGIGTSTPRWVSTRLVEAAQESPGLDVVLRHVPWGREVADLVDGKVDVVFQQRPPGADPDPRVRSVDVAGIGRVAVFAAGHRLAARSSLSIGDLDAEPIVDAGSERDVWLVDPRPSGAVPVVVGPAATTVEEMLAVVATGRAMAITSEAVASAHRSDDLVFVPLRDLEPLRLHLVALADDARASVQALLASF
ncbi:LysR family transcriptional regulator [Kineococcus rhizosphaerae]|uniref:LysR family transcriptional regulator n=1 Tax=Kineococcus rhizosphaerae TaxID=559628 RepID=A0A2T0R0U4_9ACTN|nr:LysR family transcriptional regulator [Kineococcus rhizosphaerae]PRY12913.1 LysR family transcriptional regulator [Kineococcus rhizosphaerae]